MSAAQNTTSAKTELQQLLALNVKTPDDKRGVYRKNPLVHLLQGWANRHATSEVLDAFVALPKSYWDTAPYYVSLWMFEQALQHPQLLSRMNARFGARLGWARHAWMWDGVEDLFIARMQWGLDQPPNQLFAFCEQMHANAWDTLGGTLVRKKPLLRAFAVVAQALAQHPHPSIRQCLLFFPDALLDALGLPTDTLFAAERGIHTAARNAVATSYVDINAPFLDTVVPNMLALGSGMFKDTREKLEECFLNRKHVRADLYEASVAALMAGGWSERMAVKTLCPSPLSFPYTVDHTHIPFIRHSYKHMRGVFDVWLNRSISSFVAEADDLNNQTQLWTVLAEAGVDLEAVSEQHRQNTSLKWVQLYEAIGNGVVTGTNAHENIWWDEMNNAGWDAFVQAAPSSVAAMYRIFAHIFGGQDIAVDVSQAPIWPAYDQDASLQDPYWDDDVLTTIAQLRAQYMAVQSQHVLQGVVAQAASTRIVRKL